MIFIRFGKIKGSATADAFQGWCEVENFQFDGINHAIRQTSGSDSNRITRKASIGEVSLSKTKDNASIALLEHCLSAKVIDEVEIAFVSSGNRLQKYTVYHLHDVLLSHYSESHQSNSNDKPTESISLNFTSFECSFIPYDRYNNAGAPVRTGYDLASASMG